MPRCLLLLVAAAFLVISPGVHAQGSEPYLGQILMVGFNFAPRGWAICQGQIMPIAQNTALFSLLGTTYGGDGVDTFALPDLRGRVPIHSGEGNGLQDYILGATGGQEVATLTVAQMPAHTHPMLLGQSALGDSANPTGRIWASQSRLEVYSSATPDSMMGGGAISPSPSGGGQPYDNRSPYLVVTYIIALEGVFPSQN
jgi:microcystin-dependent protein